MMKRKILTAAVAAATLAAGTAQAVIVGQGGTALLVPYVEYDTAGGEVTNTMVQITVGSETVARQLAAVITPNGSPDYSLAAGANVASPISSFKNFAGLTTDFPALDKADPTAVNVGVTALPVGQVARAGSGPNLHWYFFNADSVHQLDDSEVVSANDMFLFDWGSTVQALGAAAVTLADGVPGYLVFGSNTARSGADSELILWGDAMQINGNWESAAYIPVLPLNDWADPAAAAFNCTVAVGCDEVTYNGSYPTSVNPFVAGMTTGDGENAYAGERLTFDIPYFVPNTGAGILGETRHVIWVDQNYDGGTAGGPFAGCTKANWAGIGVEVYNTDETTNSAVVTFNRELNIIDVASVPGAQNGVVDADGVADAGFVWYNAPEATVSLGAGGASCVGTVAGDLYTDVHGGIAFALVDLLGGNLGQVQTEMAHERGIRQPPFQP